MYIGMAAATEAHSLFGTHLVISRPSTFDVARFFLIRSTVEEE